MADINTIGSKRSSIKAKRDAALRSKLHSINTRAVSPPRPLIDKQVNMGPLQQADRFYKKAAASALGIGAGVHLTKYAKPLFRMGLRNPLSGLGIGIVGQLVADALDPKLLSKVDRKIQDQRQAENKRKIRVRTGEGSLFQRALDFDGIEYFKNKFSGDKKKTPAPKIISVSKSLTSGGADSGKVNPAKPTKRKAAPTTGKKEAPRKRFITVHKKDGGTFKRKNPYYGK